MKPYFSGAMYVAVTIKVLFLCPPPPKVCRWHLVTEPPPPPPKGPPGASSNRIVRPSVSNSVPLTHKVQYLKFGWWYSNQSWTVSLFMGLSPSLISHAPGVEWVQNVGLRDFCHILTLLPPGIHVKSRREIPSFWASFSTYNFPQKE